MSHDQLHEFEVWADAQIPPLFLTLSLSPNMERRYYTDETENAWRAWKQASLKKLPEKMTLQKITLDGQSVVYVDRAIMKTVFPQAYEIIDALLSAQGSPPKELVIRARRLLPAKYANSFEAPKKDAK